MKIVKQTCSNKISRNSIKYLLFIFQSIRQSIDNHNSSCCIQIYFRKKFWEISVKFWEAIFWEISVFVGMNFFWEISAFFWDTIFLGDFRKILGQKSLTHSKMSPSKCPKCKFFLINVGFFGFVLRRGPLRLF